MKFFLLQCFSNYWTNICDYSMRFFWLKWKLTFYIFILASGIGWKYIEIYWLWVLTPRFVVPSIEIYVSQRRCHVHVVSYFHTSAR